MNATTLPAVLTGIQLVLTLAVPLVILAVGIVVRRRVRRAMTPGIPLVTAPRIGRITAVVATTVALGTALFSGFVGAAVLGALVPGTISFAADVACDGAVEHSSTNYSYKPGQHGTARTAERLEQAEQLYRDGTRP